LAPSGFAKKRAKRSIALAPGLGLAISKAVVEMHGGKICAKSEVLGKGAQFMVELPIVEEADQ
jgi:signal transduction histidine kinase